MSVGLKGTDKAHIRIGLLSRSGIVPERSGLNWGQRPRRNGNEAYIAIPIQHTREGFFPPIGQPFHVTTDSGHTLTLVRCQQHGKVLQSLPHNHLLGLYFRERLGIASGAPPRSAGTSPRVRPGARAGAPPRPPHRGRPAGAP
ncbi:MAG: hypothetical protein ACKOCV_00300 [Gemmatimonadota bacterium]